MTDQFGTVYCYVVPCAGCHVKMVVPNPHTDVCPACVKMADDFEYPLGEVRG